MLADASTIAGIVCRKMPCLALALALAAGPAAAAQTAPGDADAVDAAVGGIALRLIAPPGQTLGAAALESIYLLHNVSGDGLRALAVYLAPDAALGYQCQLIAFDRRLRALEQCTTASIAPALQAESVEPMAGQFPNT